MVIYFSLIFFFCVFYYIQISVSSLIDFVSSVLFLDIHGRDMSFQT